MLIHNKVVVDIATDSIVSRDTFEYTGPVAQAISSGSSKSRSQQQSTQESGTAFNEDFLNKALRYFGNPKQAGPTGGAFDPEAYLKQNPDVAANPYFAAHPEEHYNQYGQAEGRQKPTTSTVETPTYDPTFVRSDYKPGAYTGAAYTPVDGGDFNKIESNLYEGSRARLNKEYDANVARQREELSQSGALNSPSQFLEGSARSSLDRSYLDSIQQAARDASTTGLQLKAAEAGRRTGFDVGEAARRTGYDVGEATRGTQYGQAEAGRETQFNEQRASALLDEWFKKLALAIESGRFTRGESTGYSKGGGSQFGLVTFGPSSSDSSTSNNP